MKRACKKCGGGEMVIRNGVLYCIRCGPQTGAR